MTSVNTPSATLLIVDDEEINRQMLTLRLQRRGFTVVTAQNGYEALQIIAQQPIDLMLLDVMMPGLNGMEVLRLVRKTRPILDLPIIMTTALDQSQDVIDALDLGANDYLIKPIDFSIMLARINVQLEVRRQAASGPRRPTPAAAGANAPKVGPGMVLDGKYRLEAALGTGGVGTVYRATHLLLGHSVAVKILRASSGTTPEQRARFQREGIAACRIRHPNAVAVLDFAVTEDGITYLVMELLQGRSLADELREEGILAPPRTAELLSPICDVLAEAHAAGIVHRDLKPANIFLQAGRQGEVVKVVDFGIAKLVDDEIASYEQPLTMAGHVLGTPAYMAPERLLRRPYDGRADIYSLGVMLYQMLGGRLPFHSPDGDPLKVALMQINDPPPSLRELQPAISPEIEALVLGALAKNPEQRPSAAMMGRQFAAAVRADNGRRLSRLLRHPVTRAQEAADEAAQAEAEAEAMTPAEAPAEPPRES